MSLHQTGSRRVVVNVNNIAISENGDILPDGEMESGEAEDLSHGTGKQKTGSKKVVANVWSDAAREAAAEARAAAAAYKSGNASVKADKSGKIKDHEKAAQLHSIAAGEAEKAGDSSGQRYHSWHAAEHQRVANSIKREGWIFKQRGV